MNKYNLPEALVKVLTADTYSNGGADCSITDLLLPSRIFALKKLNPSLERDPGESIYSLLGRTVHSLIEEMGTELTEERLFTTLRGWTVSGQLDSFRYSSGELEDWKTTRVDAFLAKKKENFSEWKAQLNGYALLLNRDKGITPSKITVYAIFMDWSPSKASRDLENYPQTPIGVVEILLKPLEETLEWMISRILSHQAALETLPMCSPEERWERGGAWAAMKGANKKATKLFPTEEEGWAWIHQQNDAHKFDLIQRPTEDIRCQNYCPCAKVCSYWQEKYSSLFDKLA